MLILFLDTASNKHSLALCSEREVFAYLPLKTHGDADLVPTIEAALKENGYSYRDLTHLVSLLGPGGFTSLRVGVTAINTLAYALGLPSAGIHLSDLWSSRVKPQQNFLWLHSTRRTQIFVKGYGADGTITPVGTFGLEDAVQLQGSYVGELIPEHQTLLARCIQIPEKELTPFNEFLPEFLAKLPYQKQQLEPWYGREAD